MKRVLTAIALLAVAVYLIFWAPMPVFRAAAVCMGLICYWEYAGLVSAHGIPRADIFGIIAGLILLFWPHATLPGITILVMIALAAALRSANLQEVLPRVACTFLGTLYAFAPWRLAIDLRMVSVHLLFFALAMNWAGDTLAYYAGRRFGKHKLAPVVSPSKTWEGAAASVVGSLLFGLLYLGHFLPGLSLGRIALFSVAGNIAGQFGDLAESAIKRGAGVKDSGNMLPGHGGMLDRVDSSLFALPMIYLLLILTSVNVRPGR